MKVVFDTNILVSALALPGGRADLAMERLLSGEDQLVISHAPLNELLEGRPFVTRGGRVIALGGGLVPALERPPALERSLLPALEEPV